MQTIKTKLKFTNSSVNGGWVGFVSVNVKNGCVRGVRETDEVPKKVCVVGHDIAGLIESGILYDVEMIPMKNKNAGYIVLKAVPHEFTAKVETSVIPKVEYKAIVTFGNKKIVFDPCEGKYKTMNTIEGAVNALRYRKDVKNIMGVIDDFTIAAEEVMRRYKADGQDLVKWRKKNA